MAAEVVALDVVESWQERWAEEDYRLVAEPDLLDSARALLSTAGTELVIRESVRATRLRRVDGVDTR